MSRHRICALPANLVGSNREFVSQPGMEHGQAYGAAGFDLDANAIEAAERSLVAR